MLSGPVIHGDGFGHQLGYPTANIPVTKAARHFKPGVYAAIATLAEKNYAAALVIHTNYDKVEAFLIDYVGPDFYDAMITIEPKQRVSGLEKYESHEELKAKITADVAMVKEYFAHQK